MSGPLKANNIYAHIPRALGEELLQTICRGGSFRLERIVSKGHATPADEWYDQDWDEWVIVLSGHARLRLEGEEVLIELGPGDYLHLPAHRRHRVEWTSLEEETVWLALHYRPPAGSAR